MNETYLALSLVWSVIFAGLCGFFVVADRRQPQRGYLLLGAALVAASVAGLLDATVAGLGPSPLSLLAARCSLVLGLAQVVFNLHFLVVYLERAELRLLSWASYASLAMVALATLATTVAQLARWEGLVFLTQYQSPSPGFSFLYVGLIALHHLAFGWALLKSAMLRRRGALALLITVMVLSPASILDVYCVCLDAEKWFLAEVAMWVYALVVLANLLSEMEGTEGLLQRTTSSLKERTAELEISYAELELMHNELSKKQQLAAVGELAAAIAHEVRNPLAIIMNAVSGMSRSTISKGDRRTLLDIVGEEAERLNHLVAELLRFARPVNASRSPASLLDICEQVSDSSPAGYHVRVVCQKEAQRSPVWVDPGLFRLALDNLVANAVQAMPDGGTVELLVRAGAFSDGTAAAVVDVKDDGCGMQRTDLERARKPFFTTKPRGTGLGIPIVDKIVEAHGGEMEIHSEPGAGTTVSLKLPLENREPIPPSYPGASHPSTRRRLRSVPPTPSHTEFVKSD